MTNTTIDNIIEKNDRDKNKNDMVKTIQAEKKIPMTMLKDKRFKNTSSKSKNNDREKPKSKDKERNIIDNSIYIYFAFD
jgi:hypothetical protein